MAEKPHPNSPEAFREACRLIGEFMFNWAALEAEMNRAVRSLFHLEYWEGMIITANIQLRDKAHIIKCAVEWYSGLHTKEWREEAKALLKDILDMNSNSRNLVAHNQFFPAEDRDGIEFYKVTARDRLNVPSIQWREKDIAEKLETITRYRDALQKTVRA
jgi:hypothetical protein